MLHKLFPASIRSSQLGVRMVYAVLIWTFLSGLVLFSVSMYWAYDVAVGHLKNRFSEIEQGVLPSLSQAMWAIDDARINTHLQGLIAIPDVGRVTLTDQLGVTIQQQQTGFEQALFSQSFPLIYTEDGDTHPVGSIQIELSPAAINQELLRTALITLITILGALSTASICMLWLFHRWISRHLKRIAAFAEQYNSHHSLDLLTLDRAQSADPDELDTLVSSINQMQQTIDGELKHRASIESQLIQHKNQLEQLVTERTKLLEQKTAQLQLQSVELAEQNSELNAYAHTVAHDLKHPVTSLIGLSTLLSQDDLNLHLEQQKSFALMIKQSALKMNDIINALLQLATIRNAQQLDLQQVDMPACVTEAITRLNAFSAEHNASIEVVSELPDIKGNAMWLEEVWINYISNAVKYSGVAPKVELGASRQGNGSIRYWVRDFGPEIKEEMQHLLFSEFQRLDENTSQGHGLGLSIVKRIIKRLNGEVGYSRLANQNEFWFSLPS